MKTDARVAPMQAIRRVAKTATISAGALLLGLTLAAAAATTWPEITRQLREPAAEVATDAGRELNQPDESVDLAPAALANRLPEAGAASAQAVPSLDLVLQQPVNDESENAAAPSPSPDRDEESAVAGASTAPTTSSAPTTTAAPSTTTTAAPTMTAAPTTTAAPRETTAPTTAAPRTTTTAAPRTTTTTSAPTTTVPPTTTTKAPAGPALLTVDFSSNSNGGYSEGDVKSDFGAIDWARTDRASIQSENGNKFLRVEFPQGGVGPNAGGAQFITDFAKSIGTHDELYLSYKVRFKSGFDWKRGGKLPGLSGGNANSGGSKPNGWDGWSARMMWRDGGAPIQYVYHPNQSGSYGEGMSWGGPNFSAGTWATVETRIKLNTPGHNDGVIQAWMNGQLVLERTGMRFRDTDNLKIDGLYFSTFFGGADSSWAPSRDEYIDFDDFKISKFPITH